MVFLMKRLAHGGLSSNRGDLKRNSTAAESTRSDFLFDSQESQGWAQAELCIESFVTPE